MITRVWATSVALFCRNDIELCNNRRDIASAADGSADVPEKLRGGGQASERRKETGTLEKETAKRL